MALFLGSHPTQRLECLERPFSSSSREEPGLRLRSSGDIPVNAIRLGSLRGWLGEPKNPGFEAIHVLLPLEQMEVLLDWSSVESIERAELVAFDCAKLYEQVKKAQTPGAGPASWFGLAGTGPFAKPSSPSHSRAQRSLLATLGFAKAIRAELGSPLGQTTPRAERFHLLCDQAGPRASQGYKATLRLQISDLEPPERWRLMDKQTIPFCALEEIAAYSRNALGIVKEPDQYELIASESEPGYFHSFKVDGGSCPVKLARTIATNGVELGPNAILSQLLTPDGAIKGAEGIQNWARDALIQAEIIELHDAAKARPVSPVSRSL